MARAFEWRSAEPAERGVDPAKLERLRQGLAARRTTHLLIMRHDRIICEWYAPESGPERPHYTASLAKALVGGMSLLVALHDGLMRLDDRAWRYIPAWRDDPQHSRITVRHLATHSSGIEDANIPGVGHFELGGWKEAFWRRQPDPFTLSRDQAPVLFEPGTDYAYSNPGMAMLAYAVTAALQGGPQRDIRSLLKARIMDPIGVPESEWAVGYGATYEVDGLPLVANWGGGSYTARAVARVGRLMLGHGEWDGRRIVDSAWADRVLQYAGTPLPHRDGEPTPAATAGWYLNGDGVWPQVPTDAFAGAGAGNQVLIVIPSLDLVIVRMGELLGEADKGETFWGGVERYLLNPLMAALVGPAAIADQPATAGPPAATALTNTPYPPSPVVKRAAFAPVSTITRHAIDSDNFPITWMDDDSQFTAYGDGWGFEPRTELKLSLGLGRVVGDPPDFLAENVRSATGERVGDGERGLKASGLVMVEGVLYMWARNAGNAQLAWSADRGLTWEWADWKMTTSFGCPTWLNYGRNYAGARDGYVYLYSQDGPSAYESYDQIVLARAPQERLRERAAYEFLARVGADGQPVWTADVYQRGPVYRDLGRCQRLDAVYCPGLRRYLLVVGQNHRGGWGIYDAPEPWGPWTTVYHTTYWGLGCTHYYRLPSKWLDPDGGGGYLVFSGRTHDNVIYDAMCVRRIEFER